MPPSGQEPGKYLTGVWLSGRQDPITLHQDERTGVLGYLSFYGNVQQASKRGVTGANTLLDNLGRFLPRGKRTAASLVPPAS